MDIDRYLAEREPAWTNLANLTATARRRPGRLTEAELEWFVRLYQRASADLSHVQVDQPDPALVARLTTIVADARTVLYGRRARRGWSAITSFFTTAFPTAVWELRRFVAVAALATLGPAVAMGSWLATSGPAREAAAPAAVRSAYVERDFANYYSDRPAAQFATEVTVNNIMVSVVALAGGMLAGAGTVAVLVGNGLNLGFAAGLFAAAGRTTLFWGLVLPHGLVELTAVMIAGGAGLSLGWAMISPGDRARTEALSAAAQRSLTVVGGLITAFAGAGIIEGFVTGSTLSTAFRVGVGVAAELSFLSYLYVFGRRGSTALPPVPAVAVVR